MKYTVSLRRSMRPNRIKSFVGFAVKARKIQYGVDNVVSAGRKAHLILFSPDLSERSGKRLHEYADRNEIDVFAVRLEEILPGRNCKALGITDVNLAEAVKSELKES